MQAVAEPPTLPQTVLLYDGECGVCDATVQFILERDSVGQFSFAPLQGDTAAGVLGRHPELPADLDSLVLVRQTQSGETVTVHSHAVLGVLHDLGGAWRLLSWLRFVPRPITDTGYRAFAAVRYRIFGRVDSCRIPRPEEASRFLP